MINDPDPGSDAAPYLILAPCSVLAPTPTGGLSFIVLENFSCHVYQNLYLFFSMSRVIWEDWMNSILNIGVKEEIINPLRQPEN